MTYLPFSDIVRVEFPYGPHLALTQEVPQETPQDVGGSTAYDSVWATTGIPVQQSTGVERVLLKEDKLYTVLAVVVIIWIGIVYYLFRTDRKIDKLERMVAERIPGNEA